MSNSEVHSGLVLWLNKRKRSHLVSFLPLELLILKLFLRRLYQLLRHFLEDAVS